jgi:hypothetical protein
MSIAREEFEDVKPEQICFGLLCHVFPAIFL